jgi:hypothetical protein
MKTELTPGVSDPEIGALAETAMKAAAIHNQHAQAAGMSPQQFAMKHKESDGEHGHRARLHLALHGLKKHDAMAGSDDDEKDAFNNAMDRQQIG